ncbi:hypothetical protein SK128_025176 [Halocaridina rubra]|uniref:MAM domain-containing protein n=1 Tax=Halocaridina rubra TaxID=373956 RepID=A0AAN8WQA5_HALRR
MGGEVHNFFRIPGRDGPTDWIFVQQTYQNLVESTFAFVIEGSIGNATGQTEPSVVAIDDFSLALSPCPRPGECAFESAHLCTWNVEYTDGLTWKLSDGQEIHGNGPDVDHTTNTSIGGFAIMEIFDGQSGKIGSLVSEPIMDDIYGFCFTFFFYMYCDNAAALSVSIRNNGSETTLWALEGHFSPDWTYGKVGIPTSLFYDEIVIVINGVAGSGSGWIAIDDLFTATGECSIEPPGATPVPVGPTTPSPGTNIFSCNFEIDICGMVQSASDDFDWEHQTQEEPEELPAGGYILADSVIPSRGANASVATPLLPYSGIQCLGFE